MRRDLDSAVELLSKEFQARDPASQDPFVGKETAHHCREGFLNSFPDWEDRITEVAPRGEIVALELFGCGTHEGPLKTPQGTLPATHRRMEVKSAAFFRVNKEGLITEARIYWDMASAFSQLGYRKQKEATSSSGRLVGLNPLLPLLCRRNSLIASNSEDGRIEQGPD